MIEFLKYLPLKLTDESSAITQNAHNYSVNMRKRIGATRTREYDVVLSNAESILSRWWRLSALIYLLMRIQARSFQPLPAAASERSVQKIHGTFDSTVKPAASAPNCLTRSCEKAPGAPSVCWKSLENSGTDACI